MKIKKKIKIIILSSLYSISKISITSVFLILNEKSCELPLENWLYLLILNDIIHFCCSLFECNKMINYLQINSLNNVQLNDSFDSNFFNPDYAFNDQNQQICNNLFLVKELNKMFLVIYFFGS